LGAENGTILFLKQSFLEKENRYVFPFLVHYFFEALPTLFLVHEMHPGVPGKNIVKYVHE